MENYRKTSHSTYVASSGNVTDEIIAEYIRYQDIVEHTNNDNFNVGSL